MICISYTYTPILQMYYVVIVFQACTNIAYIYFKHAVYYIHHVYIFLYTLEYFCIYIFEGA